jgi:hypothetical protein
VIALKPSIDEPLKRGNVRWERVQELEVTWVEEWQEENGSVEKQSKGDQSEENGIKNASRGVIRDP